MKSSINKIILLPLIFIWLLSILDFFFKDYNHQNKYELTVSTYAIIFLIVLLITCLFVLKHSQESDTFIKYMKGFAYGAFFGFASVLFMGMIKNQTAFHFNKTYAKKEIEEDFLIIHRLVSDGDNIVGLRSIDNGIWFSTTNKFSLENLIYIQKNDTIKIKYGMGLLNKPFLPYGELEIIK
jgi:hypothetical protein